MNLDKALQTLGLKRNFTEQELKKAYRQLITKYHPDKFESKSEREKKAAEESSKEINVAKEYLENYLKEKTSNERTNSYKNNSNIDLTLKKQQLKIIINNMMSELSKIPNILFDEMLKTTREKIIVKLNIELIYIDSIYSILLFQSFEASHYTNIAKILEQFEKDYCKKYNIKVGNKKLERYSLKKLYEQLEQLKKEQNGFCIEEILDKELGKYIYYNGYQVIKYLIEKIKNDIIKKNSNVMDTKENIINEFNKRVLIEFKEYYKRLEILNKFKKMNLTKIGQKKLLAQLEENITKAEIFEFFLNRIKEELETTSSLKKTQKLKNNKYNKR